VDGPQRGHYPLFCLLDYEAEGRDKPLLVVIDGRSKAFRTTLSDEDYAQVRALGTEYRARNPRRRDLTRDELPLSRGLRGRLGGEPDCGLAGRRSTSGGRNPNRFSGPHAVAPSRAARRVR